MHMKPIPSLLTDWYRANGRNLPWRETSDPYKIWVSEIILQQTQVAQGLPYYLAFVRTYPTVGDLAAAPVEDVLKLWQGLGYYSRARNMHRAARTVAERWHGRFPQTPEELRTIPGIGPYTAAAVASFAFKVPVPAVDGNVCRVVARCTGLTDPVDTAAGRKMVEETARGWMASVEPDLFNQAIMDFGAMQCVPAAPHCDVCVLREVCVAFKAGLVADLPAKKMRPKVRDRYFSYIVVRCGGTYYLQQRTGKDIWCGLFEFPLIETDVETAWDRLPATEAWQRWFRGTVPTVSSEVYACVHQLTHQRLHVQFVRVTVGTAPCGDAGWLAVRREDLGSYAVPRVIDRYLQTGIAADSF